MSKPYYTDYEYWLAKQYRGKRNKFSGAGKFEKLDVTARLVLIEAKTAPLANPTSFVIGEEEFNKYKTIAHKKGLRFVFAVSFANISISCQTETDFNLLGLDLEDDWKGWKQKTNRYGSHTLNQDVFDACAAAILKTGISKWFMVLDGWKEKILCMPTIVHAEEMRLRGLL